MRIGWREFIKQKLRKPSKFHSLGIEFGENGLHLSVFEKRQEQLVWTQQHSLPLHNWQKQLKELVDEQKLDNTRCYVALSIGRYQLLQVDKPNVAEGEINQALNWSVKELMPANQDIVIDYFDMPAQSAGSEKVNVVAANAEDIQGLVKGVVKADLQIQRIGIEELATCNLLDDSNDAVITLMQEPGEEICLNIVKHKQLYFARRLRGYENLASFSEQELQMGVVDSLSVEIQRSMDYFESQLRQAPVKQICLAVDSKHLDTLANQIEQMTFKPTVPFFPNLQKSNGLMFEQASYTSLGAALAGEQTNLAAGQ